MAQFWGEWRIRVQVRVWIIPTVYLIVALVLGRLSIRWQLPVSIPEQTGFLYTPATAISLLASIVTGMISFTGIVFSMIFVMVQFGSTAYSPRLTGYLLATPVVQHAMGVFIATFIYSLKDNNLLNAHNWFVKDRFLLRRNLVTACLGLTEGEVDQEYQRTALHRPTVSLFCDFSDIINPYRHQNLCNKWRGKQSWALSLAVYCL
jgi:uncharacterized membrane protein